MSALESMTSVVMGYLLTVFIQYYLFPVFGIVIPLQQTLLISVVIVFASWVKNYLVRRLFNRIYIKNQAAAMET